MRGIEQATGRTAEQTAVPPLVTVVIPAYNAADTLARALESALRQDYAPLEIIVVDDGSSDATAEVAQSFRAQGVRVIGAAQRQGVSAARNLGIQAAQGDFIAFLDADDAWLATKTSRQMEAMQASPRLSFIACAARFIAEDGQDRGLVNAGRPVVRGDQAWKALLAYSFIATPSVLVRRAAVLQTGLFDPALRVAEDQDLWIRLARAGDLGYLDEPLVQVFDRPNSLGKASARDTVAAVLGMLARHLKQEASALSVAERRGILARRYTSLGRMAYLGDAPWLGFSLLLKAAVLGHRPLHTVTFLLRAMPPLRRLRRRIFGEGA